MNTNYLKKLEFNKILEELSTYCTTYVGKEIAQKLEPSNNKQIVKKLLSETRRGNKSDI